MNISPVTNYFQSKKINRQKYATNNINFGMAKVDQVQLSSTKEDYYKKAREDYIGHFWTFHPEGEQYTCRLESSTADLIHFVENCTAQELQDALNAKKYGVNKNQNFYQAVNLSGYDILDTKGKRRVLDEISAFPALKDGEQRRTVLSDLALGNISKFKHFVGYGLSIYNQRVNDKILNADTFLWDTLDTAGKCFILDYMTTETGRKLMAQEMEKLPEVTSQEDQESILTAYLQKDERRFIELIFGTDKETLISWMKKDNVFIKKLGVFRAMQLAKRVGIKEFDKIYGEKYGRLFDSFFNPRCRKIAIDEFGPKRYKEQYEQEYGDWEEIKYDSYLYDLQDARNREHDIGVLGRLRSDEFKQLKLEYQLDFITRLLDGEFEDNFGRCLDDIFDNNEIQSIVEDYAMNNEDVSIEDSISILEGLLKIYKSIMEYYHNKGRNYSCRVDRYQSKIIDIQMAIQSLRAQLQ